MNQKKKKTGGSWALLILLIPFLMRMLDGELPPVAFVCLAVGVLIAVIGSVVKKKSAAAGQAPAQRAAGATPARKTPEVELHRPVPSMQRREPSTQRSFSKPDAYCVTCENTGEDHFARDRQRRIAQLDDWLKNGLIDRQEYLVLKRRFENDQ